MSFPTKKRIKRRWGASWTLAELKQLGKVPDSVLARRTGRTIHEVVAERERLRIRLPTPPRRWTAREIRLLGRFNDRELARRLRRSYASVRKQRIALRIPSLRPLCWRLWTRAEEKLVGKIPDKELARRLGRSLNSVKAHRIILGLQKYHLQPKPWTDKEERFLGTAPDSVIAARTRPQITGHRRPAAPPRHPTRSLRPTQCVDACGRPLAGQI